MDLILWKVVVEIIIRGLDRTKEGLSLLLKIKNCLNNKRYFTDASILPSDNEINTVLNMESVYNFSDNKTDISDKVNEYLYKKKIDLRSPPPSSLLQCKYFF